MQDEPESSSCPLFFLDGSVLRLHLVVELKISLLLGFCEKPAPTCVTSNCIFHALTQGVHIFLTLWLQG